MTRVWVYSKPEINPQKLLIVEQALKQYGFEVAVHPLCPPVTSSQRLAATEAVKWGDLALAVGGDGTLIRAFYEVGGALPILGINSGGIGYLMEVDLRQLSRALEALRNSEYAIEERLVGKLSLDGEEIDFVNETLIITAEPAKLIKASVLVDSEPILSSRLDGVIVATPTGSTAHALSAGGPVVDPKLDAFVVVPLSPFSTTARTVVLSSKRRIVVEVQTPFRVAVDGVCIASLGSGTSLHISESQKKLRLIKLPVGEPFLSKMKRRLLDILPNSSETY